MPSSPELVSQSAGKFTAPPDPAQAGTLDELVEQLRLLKVWAGDPSYGRITDRINAGWTAVGRPSSELARKNTVADCFKTGRRRMNTDLVIAVVQALCPDVGYVAQWRQALRVIGGEAQAASQVRVQDSLPPDLAAFTGRTPELDQLREALHDRHTGGSAVAISAIEGMAGVGKTQLAIHAAHMLVRQKEFERVLFVNLRGFHPDPAQPPTDPAAVLDGFLRLLGVPSQQIPHDLPARISAYRERLAGTQTLVILDDAADAEQVSRLLPDTPGCLALVTSRRHLTDLRPATRLTVDVFTAAEALAFLTRAVPDVPVGSDPSAAERIASRCGYLPLALGLVTGHIRSRPGWTLTDHADRLDERHRDRRLESGVELAFNLSYRHLPGDQQRFLRLASLHPGQDLDAYAAAALADTDLATAQARLHRLSRDHLLQESTPGRYSFHDLVRAYAASRAGDEDPPPQRRAAATRLFDFYLEATTAAVALAYPYERQRRVMAPPAAFPAPDLADRGRADRWLDDELANLFSAAQHMATHGWPEHVWQLSATLERHLRTRGRYQDAETLHQQALHLARELGNPSAEVTALNALGQVDRMLGRHEQSADQHSRALHVARATGDSSGERDAHHGLGNVSWILGRHKQAGDHYDRALQIARDIGDRLGEQNALAGLGSVHWMLGRYEQAVSCYGWSLKIALDIDDLRGQTQALTGLGDVHRLLGRHEQAGGHYRRALRIADDFGDLLCQHHAMTGLGHVHSMLGGYEQAGDYFGRALQIARDLGARNGELTALTGLGHVHRTLGHHSRAADCYQQVLDLARALSNANWQFEALQGLGRLHHVSGRPDVALTHHQQALQLATDLAQPADQARAHDGLAHAHRALDDRAEARRHWQHALTILTALGTDHTEDIEASVPNLLSHLAALDEQR